ncbi:MAG: Clp protease N-terminal domain-containing protein, partial [Verrucomicrobiales bacterium]
MTHKLQEALQNAQQLAVRSGHSELRSSHLLLALLQQEGGIVGPILEKAEVDLTQLKAAVASSLGQEARVQGAGSQPQMSYGLRATLDGADQAREK